MRIEMQLHKIVKLVRITKLIWDRRLPTKSSKEIFTSKLIDKWKRSRNLKELIEDYNELGRITLN